MDSNSFNDNNFSFAAKLHWENERFQDGESQKTETDSSFENKFKIEPSSKTNSPPTSPNNPTSTNIPKKDRFKKFKKKSSNKIDRILGRSIREEIDKQVDESNDMGVKGRWELTKLEYREGRKSQKKAVNKFKNRKQIEGVKEQRRLIFKEKDRLYEARHGHKSVGGYFRSRKEAKSAKKAAKALARQRQMQIFLQNKFSKTMGEEGAKKAVGFITKIISLITNIFRLLFAYVAAPFIGFGVFIAVALILGAIVFGFLFGTVIVSTCGYAVEDSQIESVTLRTTQLEAQLEKKINDIPSEWEYQHIDEFNFDIDPIKHNPFELMSYLIPQYPGFEHMGEVMGAVDQLHDERYKLDLDEEVEIRYREESYTDADGEEHTHMVPYEYYILNVTLKSKTIEEVAYPKLIVKENGDLWEWYKVLMETKGLRQDLKAPFPNWEEHVTSLYGYRRDPIGKINLQVHHGIDIAAPQGTRIFAGTDGIVSAVGYSDIMGKYIIIENPKDKTEIKYAHCLSIFADEGQAVKEGEFIAAVGNTGQSTGAHLHLEVKRDGQYLNPLFYFESERNDENEV